MTTYGINVNLNIANNRNILTNGARISYLKHERRKMKHYKNKGINHNLSKYNQYHDYINYTKAMNKLLTPYVKHHNSLKSVKKNPSRKIQNVHQLLIKRGCKVPYKFAVLKMGTGQDKRNLVQLFKNRDYTYKDYTNAINEAFNDYGLSHNRKHSKYTKFTHLDVNQDEGWYNGQFCGADHCHVGILATSHTHSGKVSLSFDRAIQCEYNGQNSRQDWQLMQRIQAKRFLKCATKAFQKYLGPQFQFKLQRNTKNKFSHLSHDNYVKLQNENDKLKKVCRSESEQSSYFLADIQRLANWKNKATKIMLEAYKGLNIARITIPRLKEEVKMYHKKIIPQLKSVKDTNDYLLHLSSKLPSPKTLAIAGWLASIPTHSYNQLQKLSHMQSDTLLSSFARSIIHEENTRKN